MQRCSDLLEVCEWRSQFSYKLACDAASGEDTGHQGQVPEDLAPPEEEEDEEEDSKKKTDKGPQVEILKSQLLV